jgi:hypothetical protein
MNEERHDISNVTIQQVATPRWIGIAVVVLALVSLGALGVGWSASNRSKTLEQSLSTLSTLARQTKQGDEVLGQRFAKAEDINAQLQGELSVVTDRMKLTQAELNRGRAQAKQIKEDNDKELAELQSNTAVRLKVEENQLVNVFSEIGFHIEGLKGP